MTRGGGGGFFETVSGIGILTKAGSYQLAVGGSSAQLKVWVPAQHFVMSV
jgi:hypothetical protein